MLKGKTILLGVTGSIAAYKIAYLASALVKAGAKVHVLMTQNATNFINPITFETLTGNKCLIDTFDRNFQFSVEHVSLAKEADVFMVAPASANVIGKLAHGIADDMLTTTFMACTCPKIISPAMNTRMYENPITQDNLKILEHYGMEVIRPASGYLACGDTGAGKMPEPETLFEYILRTVGYPKDMAGKKVLITAGPTREAIDPVRYITNHSTGKMGYAIAKAAAVADYRPAVVGQDKIKKTDGDMSIALERTKDILGWLGQHRTPGQFLCGFSMETRDMLENSRAKLARKNLDMIVANNLKVEGAGFGTDTNVVTIITKDSEKELPKMSKEQVADELLTQILDFTS